MAQLVARTAGGREVAGSSPVTPTTNEIIGFYEISPRLLRMCAISYLSLLYAPRFLIVKLKILRICPQQLTLDKDKRMWYSLPLMNRYDHDFLMSEPQSKSTLPPVERPNFYELEKNAEAGIVKRGLARYLITQNYERSLKWHQRLGSPIVRKLVMGTVGRISTSGSGSNYRLDDSRSKIESATNFAFRGSVINEVVHTAAAMPASIEVANSIIEGRYGTGTLTNAGAAGFNLALVALQRYNRARMIKRVDEELRSGATFRPSYENYLGIDARAVENYEASLERPHKTAEDSAAPDDSIPVQPLALIAAPYPVTFAQHAQ